MKIEIRSSGEAVIEGYVNAVERDSRVLPQRMCAGAEGEFVERVKAGTFKRALDSGRSVELMYNHERHIGRRGSNLELKEDNIGLYAKATVTDPYVIAKAKAGELRGWSFGFNCIKDSWESIGENRQRRYLDEIRLLEVSILDKTPAYIGTSIEMRGEKCVCLERRGSEESPETVDDSAEKNKFVVELCKRKTEILKMKGVKG
ncbi:MAG: HK97 family phage prohead protease [Bacteroides sp.]|nr:HK97 family phage prohead protease [Bacteroides sp.]